MAAAPDPDEVLRSTDETANFQRLARLLISGGTSLLREIFDTIHQASNLPTVLSNPATKKKLKAAKLTKPQWHCLYPSSGVYGKSADFDVTLLFGLLRTICNLRPPPTGWDALPASTDHSLTADLARIKYYRNSVYGHVNQKMEIPDDQFLALWQEISDALVRIAAQISHEKKTAWQKAIDDFRKDPLTADDERNVQELNGWYKNDMDVKESVEELKTTTQEGIDRLETRAKDFQVELKETSRMIERGNQCLETAVREEAQYIKDRLEEIHCGLKDRFIFSIAGSQHTGVQLQNDYKDPEGPGTQGRAMGTSTIPQKPQAVVQGANMALISSNQPQALIRTTSIGGESVENRSIPSAQDVLSTVAFKYVQSVDPTKPEDFNDFLEYMEKMRKVLFNHGELVAKKILKELYETYRAGQVNEMAQTFLEAGNFLKEHGLIEEHTACRQGALKPPTVQLQNDYEDTEGPGTQGRDTGTSTITQEPQAVVQGATMAHITLYQPQELITTVTDPASMKNDDDASYLRKNQKLLKQIRKKLALLDSIREQLHDALNQWIRIRARTMEELEKKIELVYITSFLVCIPLVGIMFAMENCTQALEEGQVVIVEDRFARIKFQRHLSFLEKFIPHMAKILKLWHNDPVMLRELEGSYSGFCAKLFGAIRSAATSSSSAEATAGTGLEILLRRMTQEIEELQGTAVYNIKAIVKKIRMSSPDEEETQDLVESFIYEKFTEAYNGGR